MYPEAYYDDNRYQQKPRDPLTLYIYPSKEKTQFEVMEDDGITYKFKTDRMYNKTLIECEPVEENSVKINITGQHAGSGYKGMPEQRNYSLSVDGPKPQAVIIGRDKLTEMKDTAALVQAADGWYFDSGKKSRRIRKSYCGICGCQLCRRDVKLDRRPSYGMHCRWSRKR